MYRSLIAKLAENEEELKTLVSAYFPRSTDYFLKVFKKSTRSGDLKVMHSPSNGMPGLLVILFNAFGGLAYLVYRRWYKHAAIYALLAVATTALDTVTQDGIYYKLFVLISLIFICGFINFFIIRKFCNSLILSGYGSEPIEKVEESLKKLGGENKGVAVVIVLIGLILTGVYIYSSFAS
jgi:hypothetical protein